MRLPPEPEPWSKSDPDAFVAHLILSAGAVALAVCFVVSLCGG